MDLSKRILAKLADWEEKKHPRADDGKFGDGPGDGAKPKKKRAPRIKKQPHDESVKDTPEYDVRKADKKIAAIREELDRIKKQYEEKFGQKPPTEPKPKKKREPKPKVEAPAKVTDHDFESATPEAKQALSDYGGISYNSINRMLRGMDIPDSLRPKNQARIEHIDSVMNASKVTTDQKVYRGMHGMGALVAVGANAIGDVIEVPNYWSTTKSDKVASGFSGGEGSVLFEINLKKGQNAIDMEGFKGTKPGSFSEEELLLPRGSKYRIVGHKVVKGNTVFTLEVDNGE